MIYYYLWRHKIKLKKKNVELITTHYYYYFVVTLEDGQTEKNSIVRSDRMLR